MTTTIDQRGVRAGEDVVAGDKHIHVHSTQDRVLSVVELLLAKLQIEIDDNQQVLDTIESLKYYHEKKSPDGIVGLEAKLIHSDRGHELLLALDKKEQFVKLLDRWSLYISAQEIFAHLLARAEYDFTMFVYPEIGLVKQTQINQIIDEKIVVPTINECGSTVFKLNHNLVMGMIYWLAEQCYIRWHK